MLLVPHRALGLSMQQHQAPAGVQPGTLLVRPLFEAACEDSSVTGGNKWFLHFCSLMKYSSVQHSVALKWPCCSVTSIQADWIARSGVRIVCIGFIYQCFTYRIFQNPSHWSRSEPFVLQGLYELTCRIAALCWECSCLASEVVWLFMGHGWLVAFLLPHAVCRTRAALWWLFRDPVNAPVDSGFHTHSSGLPRVTGARLTAAVQDPVWVLLHIQVGQKKKRIFWK